MICMFFNYFTNAWNTLIFDNCTVIATRFSDLGIIPLKEADLVTSVS